MENALYLFLSLLLAVFGLVLVLLASFMMFDRFLTFVRNDIAECHLEEAKRLGDL
jgi:hypothetical protein